MVLPSERLRLQGFHLDEVPDAAQKYLPSLLKRFLNDGSG